MSWFASLRRSSSPSTAITQLYTLSDMRTTRSKTRALLTNETTGTTPSSRKRKALEDDASPKKRTIVESNPGGTSSTNDVAVKDDDKDLVPALLSFSFEDAKRHLIQVDERFADLFEKMPCRPFEHLEQVHPFR
jgi:DNA-3-methyladenine glycosylase II